MFHHCHLPWIKQKALVLSLRSKLEPKVSVNVKDLDAVVLGVGDDDLVLQAEAEAVGRVELARGVAEDAELAPDLHLRHGGRNKVLRVHSTTAKPSATRVRKHES